MTNPEPVKRVLAAGDLATATIGLNRELPAPDVSVPTRIIESDLAGADEHDDLAWLPEASFSGPTFDRITGSFELGMGMDGPTYWRLTDHGVGAINGLIAGYPGTGRTNILRLVLVEALCSTIFNIAVADPMNRNNLLSVVGEQAVRMAGTPADTVDLLTWAAEQVEARQADAERWREPSPKYPGLVVAIDDAQGILADPYAADLAARVAFGGPHIGIALVVVITAVQPETVAGRRDLLLALGEKNGFLFDRDQVDGWQALNNREGQVEDMH
ncbi:hypothetical protein [Actinoalloteichus fjordicus]|nr:hypothetical protein [Actinoalloteichus fjordicus]